MIGELQRLQGFHDSAGPAGTGEEAKEMACLEYREQVLGTPPPHTHTCPAQSLIKGRLDNLTKEDRSFPEDGANSTRREGPLL